MIMTKEKTIAIEVKLKQAEIVRRFLSNNDLLRNDLKIYKKKSFVYLPIKGISKKISSYNILSKEFDVIEKKPKSYKEIVSIPNNLKRILPSSYDIIGDIIIIKLSNDLIKYKNDIGKALLKINKNIKTVYNTISIYGEFRKRNVEFIYGENRTKTIHKEFGLKFYVDIKKVFFSPRLATERKRVAKLVKPCETVLDMFTGVAPFPIMIAKYAKPEIIYAIDKNKDAIDLAKKNILINKVLDKIEVINIDSKEIYKLFRKKNIKLDRIIMNLPFFGYKFFNYAIKILKEYGFIHFYTILDEENIKRRINELKKIAKKNRYNLESIDMIKIKTYAPREIYICLDITAKKNADVA